MLLGTIIQYFLLMRNNHIDFAVCAALLTQRCFCWPTVNKWGMSFVFFFYWMGGELVPCSLTCSVCDQCCHWYRVCPWSLNETNGDQSTWRISPQHWKLSFNYVLNLTSELLRFLKAKIIKPLRPGTWIFWLFRFNLAWVSVLFISAQHDFLLIIKALVILSVLKAVWGLAESQDYEMCISLKNVNVHLKMLGK